MYQDIHYKVNDSVATIELNRPEVLNAIRLQTYHELVDALKTSDSDENVNIIILSGNNKCFSAGNDLADLQDPADFPTLNQCVTDIFATLAALKKPLILAQEGVAVGIGCNLLLHADIAFAGKSIRYSLPFSKIGVCSEGACSVLLAETIGSKRANELLFTGRFFSAEEAEQWGLITKQVEDGTALEQALATAREMLKNSQDSIRAIKQLSKSEGNEERVNKAVANELAMFTELLNSKETQYRLQQVQKRS